MSTGSIIAVAILVVFASLDTATTSSSLLTATPTATPIVTPSSSSAQPAPEQTVTPTSTASAGGATSVTSSPSVAPTEAPRQKTCGNIKFMVMAGNDSMYTNETALQILLVRGVFSESSKYKDVKVSGLTSTKNEGKVEVRFKLCVVIKKDDAGNIEDMLKANFTEFEFTGYGVLFKDWKAKANECSKCSETGGGGPIVIEGTCVPEADHSCNGLKDTDESNDCVKYCDSSAAAIMMSSFILAMGILVSFSFNIWK